MGMNTSLFLLPAGTVISASGDTATNVSGLSPAPTWMKDYQYPVPGVMPWSEIDGIDFAATITALTGSSASITFYVDKLGLDGQYYSIYNTGSITSSSSINQSIGPARATQTDLGVQGRLRWVLTGSSATVSVSMLGV